MEQPRLSNGRSTDRRALVGAFLLIAVLLAWARRPGMNSDDDPQERRLIVSTDDAGLCSSVNSASIAALEHGCVSSASIMTCCPGFEEFSAFAVANPQYDYGVHLTLTCDLPVQPWGPVLPSKDVASLVDDSGHFWSDTVQVAQHARIDEVERELRAQFQRAVRTGIRITHIDHHMFVLYVRADLLELYARLAVEFHVPARLCREPSPRLLQQNTADWLEAYRTSIQRLQEAGLPLIDAIESENYGQEPSAKREFHLQTLRNLPLGVTEIVIHCASLAGPGPSPPDVERREADTKFFLSVEAREEIARLGIQRLTWTDLRSVGRSPKK